MSIDAVSLTSAMRSNLISLQNTVSQMNQTQEQLSTGKKVNSALDNPLEFFTAQNLNNTANTLSGYQDGMSNAVQTIQAANAGITSISSLISQAQAIAQSAQASTVGVYGQAAITLTSVVSGDTVTVGGMTFTAVSAGAGTTQFNVGSTDDATAANLESAISTAFAASSASTGNANATAVSGNVVTLTGTTTNMSVGISGTATVSGSAQIAAATVPDSNTQADRENYRLQYSTLLTQLDKLAQDSGYNGTNLLNGDTLNVAFGTGATDQIAITGFTATSAGLSLAAGAADSWGTNAGIQTSVTALTGAQTTVNNQSANLSSGLSIINTRQTWVTSMINTLQTGANNLTLADMNQEGADMLMLQTQQSLGTTALSLSSQAAQSVLKLFP
jgi:flagellin